MIKKNTEKHTPKISLSATFGGKDVLVGEVVSINPKMGPFFMVGDIQLTPKRYWAEVSENMGKQYYETLHRGLDDGYIILGKTIIPAIDRDSAVLDAWNSLVKAGGAKPSVVAAFKELISKVKDNGYHFGEIAMHCLKQERSRNNRSKVIHLMESVLMYVEDPRYFYDPVYEEEEGKVEVQLVQTPDGVSIVGSDGAEQYKPKPPQGHIKGTSSASEVLDEVFEI